MSLKDRFGEKFPELLLMERHNIFTKRKELTLKMMNITHILNTD